MIVSSHNHDSVDLIDSQCENVGIYHMKVGKDKNGKIRFQHKITPGHAPSLAIEVAEKLGMPKEIIEMMRGYSDTQSA